MGTIVAGVDGSDASKDALRWALEEARLRGAEVVALHAWEPPVIPVDAGPAVGVDLAGILEELEAGARRLVERVVEEVAGGEPGVEVRAVAEEGSAAAALIEAARDAELLVVGSRGRGGFVALLLGSVSLECARHAPCPVLIHRARQPS